MKSPKRPMSPEEIEAAKQRLQLAALNFAGASDSENLNDFAKALEILEAAALDFAKTKTNEKATT